MTGAPPRAPFIYIGGKHRIAEKVWQNLGDVDSYVEPFAGSAAVLLARPAAHVKRREIINDSDGLIVNVWRSLAFHPDETARHADWPITESDLHARHAWLVGQRESLTERLEGDPKWCDPIAAGWWLWGAAIWIGQGWCAGNGPWAIVDGKLVRLVDGGQGINRSRPVLSGLQGVHRQRPVLSGLQGVNRADVWDIPPDEGCGLVPWGDGTHLTQWFTAIAARLERVRICSGDWLRVTTPTPLRSGTAGGIAGIFLDPPYDEELRSAGLYVNDDGSVATQAREWSREAGADPLNRIILCGLGEEHDELLDYGWSRESWSGIGGYSRNTKPDGVSTTRHTETVWMSPACLGSANKTLW